jgi:hypothetical protein
MNSVEEAKTGATRFFAAFLVKTFLSVFSASNLIFAPVLVDCEKSRPLIE